MDKSIAKETEEILKTVNDNKDSNDDDETIYKAIFVKLTEIEKRLKTIEERMSKPLIN